MTRIVLVHGAWSNATTWNDVVPLLRAAGHSVIAVTLPGHGGDDAVPLSEVGLSSYAAHLAGILKQDEPALLVGHSMGGMAISAAAELVPDRIARLVYIAAFLPQSGQSLLDLIKAQNCPGIQPAVRRGAAPGSTELDPEIAAGVLFQDATPEQRRTGMAALTPQPNRGQTDAAQLSAERFGRVPRAYIFCEQDRTVLPALQHKMEAASPCSPTFSLDCGHVPQLTCPDRLAGLLNTV